MELIKIQGNTSYIPGPTNIGVFQFKDKYTLLVDTGSNNTDVRRINDTLESRGINIKYVINSHEHMDHCGGNIYIQENFPGSIFYASREGSVFIRNDYLLPLYIYGGDPISSLAHDYIKSKTARIDFILEKDSEKINNEKFDIISLPGHARGQIGIGTRDKVCFIGDALFSEEILEKYTFPFLQDIQAQLQTFNTLSVLEYDYYVLGHSERIYTCQELPALIAQNKATLDDYLNMLLELLEQPKGREELLEEIIILGDLTVDLNEYYLLNTTLASALTYLHRQQELIWRIENGKIYFYKN